MVDLLGMFPNGIQSRQEDTSAVATFKSEHAKIYPLVRGGLYWLGLALIPAGRGSLGAVLVNKRRATHERRNRPGS
jgi:hypothetical protein